MNLQKKREQVNATQLKKKSKAFKGTQDDSSSEESTNEDDDLAFVIKRANKMIERNSIKGGASKDQTKEKMKTDL